MSRRSDGSVHAKLIPSLVDYTGLALKWVADFDLKVCSQSKFDLNDYSKVLRKSKARQLDHLYRRAQYGSVCFFMIHWNERTFKKKETEPPITYAFPVAYDHPFWEAFESGEIKAIRRSHCEQYAVEVPWNTITMRERIVRPDIHFAIDGLIKLKSRSRPVHGRWD